MRIAFTSSGTTPESPLDQRFGRAPKFVIYDTETELFESVDNTQNLNAAQGAGIQSAQNVLNTGATVVVTGHTGPKAFRILEAAGAVVYQCAEPTVGAALNKWKHGELVKSIQADVEGHWV